MSTKVYHSNTLFIANSKQDKMEVLLETPRNSRRIRLPVTVLKTSLKQRNGCQLKIKKNKQFQKFMRFMPDSISKRELDLMNRLSSRGSTKVSLCRFVKILSSIYQKINLQSFSERSHQNWVPYGYHNLKKPYRKLV
jgi:hypothetical protein